MTKKKYNEEDGVWRTIGGRKVFIRKGQSLSDAMKESGKFKKASDVKRGDYHKLKAELDYERQKEKANKLDKDMDLKYGNYREHWQDWTEQDHEKVRRAYQKVSEKRSDMWDRKYPKTLLEDTGDKSKLNGKHIAGKEKFSYNNARDILNQLNDEGSDFTFGEIDTTNYVSGQDYKKIGKLKTEVSVFMPDERGYTGRELEIPISQNETSASFEEKIRDWQSRHDNPDSFYDEDFPVEKKNEKVNYQKGWSKDGTTISQNVKISGNQKEDINRAIEEEIKNGYPNYKQYANDKYSAKMYLEKLNDNYTDTTNTTNRFIKNYLGNDKIKTDRNTRYISSPSSGNDYLPKATKITTQGTSNRKEVSDNIQAHILEHYENPVDFMEQMDVFDNMPTRWHAGQEMAKQGFYDIYYDDQRDFLDSLGINPKGKSFSDDKVFQTYTSLVGRESDRLYTKMEKLFEQYKKEHKNSNASLDDFRKWFK